MREGNLLLLFSFYALFFLQKKMRKLSKSVEELWSFRSLFDSRVFFTELYSELLSQEETDAENTE